MDDSEEIQMFSNLSGSVIMKHLRVSLDWPEIVIPLYTWSHFKENLRKDLDVEKMLTGDSD